MHRQVLWDTITNFRCGTAQVCDSTNIVDLNTCIFMSWGDEYFTKFPCMWCTAVDAISMGNEVSIMLQQNRNVAAVVLYGMYHCMVTTLWNGFSLFRRRACQPWPFWLIAYDNMESSIVLKHYVRIDKTPMFLLFVWVYIFGGKCRGLRVLLPLIPQRTCLVFPGFFWLLFDTVLFYTCLTFGPCCMPACSVGDFKNDVLREFLGMLILVRFFWFIVFLLLAWVL